MNLGVHPTPKLGQPLRWPFFVATSLRVIKMRFIKTIFLSTALISTATSGVLAATSDGVYVCNAIDNQLAECGNTNDPAYDNKTGCETYRYATTFWAARTPPSTVLNKLIAEPSAIPLRS